MAALKPSLPPVRFINLERDTERHQRMLDELARVEVAGERFPGVLWADLPPSQQAAHYSAELNKRQFHKPLVNGEKGCYASHIACWRWLFEQR